MKREAGSPVLPKFRIRTVDGPDDYASMQEVIYRRFRRAQKGDPGFERRPDLLFIDGGLGHVNAVKEVLSAMASISSRREWSRMTDIGREVSSWTAVRSI